MGKNSIYIYFYNRKQLRSLGWNYRRNNLDIKSEVLENRRKKPLCGE